MTVTAHSGCMGTQDNSIESIVAGFENGADIAEIDVRCDAGHDIVLSHDKPKDYDSCVTLDEALETLKKYPGKKYNLDIKSTDRLEEVQRKVEAAGLLDSVFFTGIVKSTLDDTKAKAPKITRYLNVNATPLFRFRAYCLKTALLVKRSGCVGVNLHHSGLTKNLVETMRSHGLETSVWTARDEKTAEKCMYYHPDNVTTTIPDYVSRAK